MNEYDCKRFMEKFSWTVGENLKYLQKEKGMTSENLANAINYSTKTINRYRNDKNKRLPKGAKEIAKALDISVEELTSESKRLERGIKEKKEKIFHRAEEIAKTLNKSVDELTSQDIQLVKISKKGVEDEKDSLKSKAEEKYREIYFNEVSKDPKKNELDLNELDLISNHKEEFLTIYGYDWTFIRSILDLDDADIVWIKELMFEYFIYSELFVRNLKQFDSFLKEIADALNEDVNTHKDNNESKYISIKKTSDDSDILSQKLNNFVKSIELRKIISKEIYEMIFLFAKLHDCATVQAPNNN